MSFHNLRRAALCGTAGLGRASLPDHHPPCHSHLQDDTIAFNDINLAVKGDITVAMWFSDHVGEWDPPALAFAFHTSFVECGVVRATAKRLDVPGGSQGERGH